MQAISDEDVRARIDWAKSRGLRRWLWPEVDPNEWRTALSEIVRVVRGALAQTPCERPLGGNSLAISVAAYTSGTGPLLGYYQERGLIHATDSVATVLRQQLYHNRRRMQALRTEAVDVVERFAANGISPTVIKGMHTSFAYFPEPACRPVSDIDLVVSPGGVDSAEDLLRGRGFIGTVMVLEPYHCDWRKPGVAALPKSLLYVHAQDPWHIDLQASLDRPLTARHRVALDAIAANAELADWPVSPLARVLPRPLLICQLAAHASESLINLTLIRLIELVLVLRAGALDWDLLKGLLMRIGPRHVYPAFFACEKLAPGLIPADILKLCERDAPHNLRRVLAGRALWDLQPIDRHSFRERHIWADGILGKLRHIAGELDPGPLNRTPRKALRIYANRVRSVRHALFKPSV
jgi:Uncharacterised nucleotidyltransferase